MYSSWNSEWIVKKGPETCEKKKKNETQTRVSAISAQSKRALSSKLDLPMGRGTSCMDLL